MSARLAIAMTLLLALGLVTPMLLPPPRPALAQSPSPHPATPSPSPGTRSPSPTPSPSTGLPSPSPMPSPSPGVSPSPLPSPGVGTPTPSPSPSATPGVDQKIHALVEKMDHLNPNLKDYTAEVAIALNIKLGLVRLPMDLHGTYYYKQPDKYKMELKNAPPLLQKYPQIFGYHPVNPGEFLISLQADEAVAGRPCWVLRLDKRSAESDFRGQTVWLDKQNFTSPRRVYNYTNSGKIDVRFKWRQENGFWVMDKADADLDFPKFSASASLVAAYSGYKFNRGLEDAVFDKK